MRKVFFMLTVALLVSCGEYDDSDLWDKVNGLESRVEELEEKVSGMNEGISSLNLIVDALQDRVYVTDVSYENNECVIKFSDGRTAVIKNGKDGADAPVIGVKKDVDGVFYWTQTVDGETSWLTEPGSSEKIPASGSTPLLKVDGEGFWLISYDGGGTYQRVSDGQGEPVKATGEDGDSFFSSVKVEGNFLTVTLSSGEVISLPMETEPYISYENAVDLGLSVKWAICNVGAYRAEEPGGLYGWADPTGSHTEEGYEYIDFYGGTNPPLDISGTNYDIVRVRWGGRWRMPTDEEATELRLQCTTEWGELNGVEGLKVIGPNGNEIFLPQNGGRWGEEFLPSSGAGFWTSTLHDRTTSTACTFSFSNNIAFRNHLYGSILQQWAGLNIRPVLDKD